MKRILSLVFAVLLVGGALMQGALAMETKVISPAPIQEADDGASLPGADGFVDTVFEPAYEQVTGTVERVDKAGKSLVIVTADEKISMRVGGKTRIVDNDTLKAAALDDIKAGDTIRVWYDSMTRFGPAVSASAQVILTGIKEELGVGHYFEVEKVEKTNQGYRFLNQEQDLYYTVPADAKIPLIGTDKTIKPSAIKPGTKLMVWYEVVALSYPGQTGGDKLVAFPYDYAGYISLVGDRLVVNGSRIRQRACETCETYMIPMQEVAKKLGIKTKWNKASGTLTLTKGSNSVVLRAGKDQMTVNGESVDTSAPIVESGRLYAKMEVLSCLGNYKLANPVR